MGSWAVLQEWTHVQTMVTLGGCSRPKTFQCFPIAIYIKQSAGTGMLLALQSELHKLGCPVTMPWKPISAKPQTPHRGSPWNGTTSLATAIRWLLWFSYVRIGSSITLWILKPALKRIKIHATNPKSQSFKVKNFDFWDFKPAYIIYLLFSDIPTVQWTVAARSFFPQKQLKMKAPEQLLPTWAHAGMMIEMTPQLVHVPLRQPRHGEIIGNPQ